jgi:hypothetical protein
VGATEIITEHLYVPFNLKLKDPFSLPVTPVPTDHRLSAVTHASLLVPIIADMICSYYTHPI